MSSELAFTNWQNTAGVVQQTTVQVKQTIKRDTTTIVTSSGTTWYDTGFECTITPKSSSNKILIMGKFFLGTSSFEIQGKFTKNNSDILGGMGTARGNRLPCGFAAQKYDSALESQNWHPVSYLYMDTAGTGGGPPGTTSPLTYKLWLNPYLSATLHINRTHNDLDNADYFGCPSSTITLMEIAQ